MGPRPRQLIARSGTAGSKVIVWASPDTFTIFPVMAVSRYFVDLLDELGYDAPAQGGTV